MAEFLLSACETGYTLAQPTDASRVARPARGRSRSIRKRIVAAVAPDATRLLQ